ncbi:hypothetical protein lerEdw1_010256 [Lerista edwardsae]|nr:hypothetical protein lerEdw1_010256 [Lerista edwardsae]
MDSAKMCGFLVSGGLLLLLTLLGDPTEACKCSPRHLQDEYCYAGFVIKANFLGHSSVEFPWRRYEIRTTKVYKLTKPSQDLRFLYTSIADSLCGYKDDPNPGEEYVISGILHSNRAWISFCHIIQPWSALTPEQQRGISLYYKKGCRCPIVPCHKHCSIKKPNSQCIWYGDLNGMEAKSMACLPKSKTPGSCFWELLSS